MIPTSSISWPGGKTFAFTVFDDPDSQTVDGCKTVYDFIASLGFRTTIGVWPCPPVRETNSPGETCGNQEYLRYVQHLQQEGFEIGYHNTTPHSSTRAQIDAGLGVFHRYFGDAPITMANHYNAEAIYWGSARLGGIRKKIYQAAHLWRANPFSGHIPTSEHFWGDLCQKNIKYCRNFVYRDINTLRKCPWMPYYDPERSFVKYWYASSEGPNLQSFVEVLVEENQDRLEAEGGACIMYTHFGLGFIKDGKLDPQFERLMTRLSRRKGWFVPVGRLLDHLQSERENSTIPEQELAAMEWKWLTQKLLNGQS